MTSLGAPLTSFLPLNCNLADMVGPRWSIVTSWRVPGVPMWLKPSKYLCFGAWQIESQNLRPSPEEGKLEVLGPTLTACPAPISPTSSFLCFQSTSSQPGRPEGAGGLLVGWECALDQQYACPSKPPTELCIFALHIETEIRQTDLIHLVRE